MPENRLILSHISSICLSSRVGDGRDGPEQQQVCPSSPRLAVGEAGMTQAAEFHHPRECISDLMRGGEDVGRRGWGADQDPSLPCCESFHHCLYQGHTSHDYCQPMMDCETHTKRGLFLGDVGPLTSSFGSTLKSCIAGWQSSTFILPFIPLLEVRPALHSDGSPASMDLAPIFSQVFLIRLIWPWHLSYRT